MLAGHCRRFALISQSSPWWTLVSLLARIITGSYHKGQHRHPLMVPPCYRNIQRFALSLAPGLALTCATGFTGRIISLPALLGGHDRKGRR